MTTLGKKIRELRNEKGLNQSELGEILNVGKSTISQYETDTNVPDHGMLLNIANYFNVTTDYLLCRTNNREGNSQEQIIKNAVSDDQELSDFWEELSKRDDIKALFWQTKDLSPEAIKRIMRYIKIVEDEETEGL